MTAPFTTRLLVIAVSFAAAVAVLSLGAAPEPTLRATAGGALKLGNSRDGQAVLDVARMKPGESASGTLVLENLVSAPQRLTLSMNGLQDAPGPAGGTLSQWLELRIERGTDEVFAGKLSDLPELDLGEIAAAASVPFRFTVTLPEHGPATDNAYAGAGVEVSWLWRADLGADPGDPPAQGAPPADRPPADPPARPVRPTLDEPSAPGIDELQGPAPTRGPRVRLWVGGRATQRMGGSLALSTVCRPECTLGVAAEVRVGRRWRTLGRRALGRVASAAQPSALRFRLSALQQRSLRATLRRRGALTVRIAVTATAPGHAPVTKVRTLRLRP